MPDQSGRSPSHVTHVRETKEGWRMWCSTCFDYGVWDDEAAARAASDDHRAMTAPARVPSPEATL